MSLIRFASPGLPTVLLDQGAAVGRTSRTRLQGGNRSIIAGELVSGDPGDPRAFAQGEAQRKRRQRQRDDVLAAQLEGQS